MPLTMERTAAWLHRRWPFAVIAGVLVWVTWLGGIGLGGSKLEKGEGDRFSHLVFGEPNGERDMIGQLVSIDHLAFYSPARMIREGREADIYDHYKIYAYQKSVFHPRSWESLEAYRNPPFYALLYLPTTGLTYAASAWIWSGVSLAALALGIYFLRPERYWRTLSWSLTFMPVFATLSYGQNSLLSFAILCGTYRLLAMKRPFLAGLVAGLLWFKPPLLIGLVLWGLFDLRRLWPAALGVVVSGFILTAVSYLAVPDAWHAFIKTLGENAKFDNFEWWKMHNPRSFWRLLLPRLPEAHTPLWLPFVALGAFGFWRVWSRNRTNVPTAFGASVALMLWASPHTMIYEWAVALIPAILWWNHAPKHRTSWQVLFALAWVVLFVGTDAGRVQIWLQEKQFGWHPAIILQFSVPILGWIGWQCAKLLSSPLVVESQGATAENPTASPNSAP